MDGSDTLRMDGLGVPGSPRLAASVGEVASPGRLAREEFARQARQCLPQLYRIARRLTAQHADAEDLVHDTYLKAFRAADRARLGTPDDCRAWLVQILVNTYRDQYRARLRSPIVAVAGADQADPIELTPSPEPGPAEQVEGRRFAEAAQAAMLDLPPELRLIMALFLIEGLTYAQVASRMAVPVGTVMSRLWRARRLLRERLRGHLLAGKPAGHARRTRS